jgi:type IV secretory pathway TraG/TraD family ATPase VirD4
LAAGTGIGGPGVEQGSFWEGKTRAALQGLLHAAALDGRGADDLFTWTLDPQAAADAVAVLRSDPRAAPGWAESLDAMIGADPRTRDSIWQGVSLALAALADPRVMDTVNPPADEQFNPAEFLGANGTLFLLATGSGAGASASLVAAFVEDLTETARLIAARSTGGRLDPPLLLALDEIANLAPLPSLPRLMADGGGSGITTMPVVQSMAQARDRWGSQAASAIWDAAIVKIILGGGSAPSDLRDISTLAGERDEVTWSTTLGETGRRSTQSATRRVPVLPPEQIRTMPFGQALTMFRFAPPIITQLRPWTARPDHKTIKAHQGEVETLIRQAAQ